MLPHLLWPCWGQSHCSCACWATLHSSSPRIPAVHPRRTLTPSPPRIPYDPLLARASTVWTPGFLSQSCSGSSVLTSSVVQHGPLKEQGDRGLSRRDAHTGGTPPDEMIRSRLERRWRSVVQMYSVVDGKLMTDLIKSWPSVFVWGCVPPGRAATASGGLGSAAGWKGLRAADWGLDIGPAVNQLDEQSQKPEWSVPEFG